MHINEKKAQEIYDDIGEERLRKANNYVRQGRVKITKAIYDNPNNFEITAEIDGNYDDYITKIKVVDGELEEASCECPDYYSRYGSCKHIAATLIKFKQTKYWDQNYIEGNQTKANTRFATFRKVVTELYNEELQEINSEEGEELPEDKKIKLEPKVIVDRYDSTLKLEFKIGTTRMYKIKDLSEFYTRMAKGDFYKYGDKLQFVHTRDNFTKSSQDILDFVLRYSEMLKYAENTSRYTYYGNTLNQTTITLGESTIDEVFNLIKDRKVTIEKDRVTSDLELVEMDPDIRFELIKTEEDTYKIVPNKEIFEIQMYNGKATTYILENQLYINVAKNL